MCFKFCGLLVSLSHFLFLIFVFHLIYKALKLYTHTHTLSHKLLKTKSQTGFGPGAIVCRPFTNDLMLINLGVGEWFGNIFLGINATH